MSRQLLPWSFHIIPVHPSAVNACYRKSTNFAFRWGIPASSNSDP